MLESIGMFRVLLYFSISIYFLFFYFIFRESSCQYISTSINTSLVAMDQLGLTIHLLVLLLPRYFANICAVCDT